MHFTLISGVLCAFLMLIFPRQKRICVYIYAYRKCDLGDMGIIRDNVLIRLKGLDFFCSCNVMRRLDERHSSVDIRLFLRGLDFLLSFL